jgi:zinc D-Ala-D-Ala carboxypeptidase
MTKLTTNFTLEEFLVSDTAAREGIDEQFNPPPEIVANLTKLANTLEVVRALLGSVPIIVSSGYRCPRLNAAVKGSSVTSSHLDGLAADFTAPKFGDPLAVCRKIAASTHLDYDQVIYEYARWCHLGVGAQMRKQALSKVVDQPYQVGLIAAPTATA